MKFFVAIVLSLNFLLGANCQRKQIEVESKPPIQSANDLDAKALSKLFEAIKLRNSKNVELKKDKIIIDKLEVMVSTVVEFEDNNQGRSVFAVRFDTKLIEKGETVFTVPSIGIGNDKSDAEQTSIDEWIGLFGTALADMLAKANEFTTGDFKVYSGLMGIRGVKPVGGWMDGGTEMNKKLINSLLSAINSRSNKEINSLNLVLSISPSGEIDGECRFNNEVSPEILTALKKLDWAKSQNGYLFKQFYLLRRVRN